MVMYDLVIKDGLCFVNGEFTSCNIGINGNEIVYVGKNEVSGEVEINASNHFVLPGLFNAHTHAAMTLFRSYAEGLPLVDWLKKIWKVEAKLRKSDVFWGTMLACLEMIKTGTTCFADMYIHMDGVAEAVGEIGIRAVIGYGMADRGDEERKREELEVGLDTVSKWNGAFEGRVTCMLTPHAPYTCSEEFLKEVAEVSRDRNLIKHIHVSETLWEVKEIKKKYGCRPVEFLNKIGFIDEKTVLAHAVWLSNEEIEILAEKNASVASCPSSNLKLSSGIAKLHEIMRGGVNVCLGTDGAASNNTLNMFAEMRIASLLQLLRGKTISSKEMIEISSKNGYKAYNIKGGEISSGKLADMIVVKRRFNHTPMHDPGSSIVFSSYGCEVDYVIVNGNIIVDSGELLTADEEKIVSKAEEVALRLVSRD